ncbi:hypothetical protein ACIHIX_46655 [Streptomyces sp. NPDC051913]|uniref:hypothetical protein n=1 Tax=Streptomyces sp. NPDC051913 TaxID=3365676 RepID=UPI0037D16B00
MIAPPGGGTGNCWPRPGPRAKHKWLTGSVEQDSAQVIASTFAQAEARDSEHLRDRIVLVDGARHQLDLIQAEAARRDVGIHIVLGIVHVLAKLWSAARCFYASTDPDAEEWVAAHAARLLNGATDDAVIALNAEADECHLTGEQCTGVDRCVRYLSNMPSLHYDQAFAKGWPIGSRAIEGAARYLVADRLAITGSRRRQRLVPPPRKGPSVGMGGAYDPLWLYPLPQEARSILTLQVDRPSSAVIGSHSRSRHEVTSQASKSEDTAAATMSCGTCRADGSGTAMIAFTPHIWMRTSRIPVSL